MTYNDAGQPFVDLRDCTGPRDILRRVELFLDEIHRESLRAEAARLVLADVDCDDIAQWIAHRRVELWNNKIERLLSVVQILEDLRKPA